MTNALAEPFSHLSKRKRLIVGLTQVAAATLACMASACLVRAEILSRCADEKLAIEVAGALNREYAMVGHTDESCATCNSSGTLTEPLRCMKADDPSGDNAYTIVFRTGGVTRIEVPFGRRRFVTTLYGTLAVDKVSAPYPLSSSAAAPVVYGPKRPSPAFPDGLSIPELAPESLPPASVVSDDQIHAVVNRATGEIYMQADGQPAPLIMRDGRAVPADSSPTR